MTENSLNKSVLVGLDIRHVFICVLTTNGSWHRNRREFFFLGGKKSKQHPVFIYFFHFLTHTHSTEVMSFIISKIWELVQVRSENRWPMGLDEKNFPKGRSAIFCLSTSGVDDDDHNDRTSLKKYQLLLHLK